MLMKYILCILFMALFTGCSTSANRTAGTVCRKLGGTCAALCISPGNPAWNYSGSEESAAPYSLPVISISLTDRTGSMFTW